MPDWVEFNPCLCTTVRNGSMLTGIFDMIYGSAYLIRSYYLDWAVENYKEFYPEPFPYENLFEAGWMKYGNYGVMIITGFILFVAVRFMNLQRSYQACYIYLTLWLFLGFTFSFLCHAMIHSTSTIYRYYGVEVLMNLLVHVYMAFVVLLFCRDSKEEFISAQSRQPIFWRATEFQKKPVDPIISFADDDLNATSLYSMTPANYLAYFPSIAKRASSVRSHHSHHSHPPPTPVFNPRWVSKDHCKPRSSDSDSLDEDAYRNFLERQHSDPSVNSLIEPLMLDTTIAKLTNADPVEKKVP